MKLLTQDKDVEVLESEKMYDLLQFRRAVVEERYEVCGFWMLQARKNGATRTEINWHISLALSGADLN